MFDNNRFQSADKSDDDFVQVASRIERRKPTEAMTFCAVTSNHIRQGVLGLGEECVRIEAERDNLKKDNNVLRALQFNATIEVSARDATIAELRERIEIQAATIGTHQRGQEATNALLRECRTVMARQSERIKERDEQITKLKVKKKK